MILIRRLLCIRDLVICIVANLCMDRWMLCCMSSLSFCAVLCRAIIPWLQHEGSQLVVTEEPAGSSHSVPTWHHLHGLAFI